MLHSKKNNSRWIILAPLALSMGAHPVLAKDAQKRTASDFLMNRKYKQGVSLFDVTNARRGWEVVRYAPLNGFPFRRSLKANSGDTTTLTISLNKKYDRFQTWVGTLEGSSRQDSNVFRVVGDGQELFKSVPHSSYEGAERVDVSVKDVEKLELIVESTGDARNRGVFAEPKFVVAGQNETQATPGNGDLVSVVRPDEEADEKSVEVQIGGKSLVFGETKPLVRGNRVLVPMEPLFEQIGAKLEYDPVTHDISATRDGRRLDLTVGSTAARIDGQLVYIDVPVQTLSAAMVYNTLKPTSAVTSSALGPNDLGKSMLPDLKAPNPAELKQPPKVVIQPKDTETTVTEADASKPVDSGPILVPLRFIAEAFKLPVATENF